MPPLRSISHPVICAPSELETSRGRRRRWLGRKSVADRRRSSNARLTGSRIPGGILTRAPYVARASPVPLLPPLILESVGRSDTGHSSPLRCRHLVPRWLPRLVNSALVDSNLASSIHRPPPLTSRFFRRFNFCATLRSCPWQSPSPPSCSLPIRRLLGSGFILTGQDKHTRLNGKPPGCVLTLGSLRLR